MSTTYSDKGTDELNTVGIQVEQVSPEMQERRLVWKLDKRIIPLMCTMFFFAALNRTNLGNARLQGLPQDILDGDPTGVLFDWANSAFFFSFILCQIPAILMSKFCHPCIWLGSVALGWGVCAVLMSTAFNFPGLFVSRLGIGVFEAGFSPWFPFYLSLFYTRDEIGLRTACWFGIAAVANAFGGLIAFGIQHAHTSIANWRLLFIVEGVPTVLLGVIAVKVLPNRPEETKFLTEAERELALHRMNRGCRADVGRRLQREHIYATFKDWKLYVAGIMSFGANCAVAGITGFLPTIITTFGFSNALAQLLSVPPYAAAAVVLFIAAYASDRLQNRGVFVAALSSVTAAGYTILLAVPGNSHVRYFATFCITIGAYSTVGLLITWFSHNLGSETKRATGTPLWMAIGQCGGVLGSHLFPATEGPRYVEGFAVTCALSLMTAIVALLLSIFYRMENRRRDALYGKPVLGAPVDTSERADEAPAFRYTH